MTQKLELYSRRGKTKDMIRSEVSRKNKYWISKNRHYELKYFCLQYPSWKKECNFIDSISLTYVTQDRIIDNKITDLTANCAIRKAYYTDMIRVVEKAANDTDEDLRWYILKGVTEGLSYNILKARFNIPCGRDMYYDRYRRFFWLLNKYRDTV